MRSSEPHEKQPSHAELFKVTHFLGIAYLFQTFYVMRRDLYRPLGIFPFSAYGFKSAFSRPAPPHCISVLHMHHTGYRPHPCPTDTDGPTPP